MFNEKNCTSKEMLGRAIAMPNHIVSLSGPTKTGKTVLCRRVLGGREFVWIDGGQIQSLDDFWMRVRSELELASNEETSAGTDDTIQSGLTTPIVTATGSHLNKRTTTRKFELHAVKQVIDTLLIEKIILVIDDFHYIKDDYRSSLMRNLKGAVFNGLKVILLSVTHRAFDVIKAEPELTGRFSSVILPTWAPNDLLRIPALGFDALKVNVNKSILYTFATEAQDNPFLMQRFC
jgi:Bacterial TniB protein